MKIDIELPADFLATIDSMRRDIKELSRRLDGADKPMNTKEAAAYAGITPDTLRKMVREGKVTCSRPGGRNMSFMRSDLNPRG